MVWAKWTDVEPNGHTLDQDMYIGTRGFILEQMDRYWTKWTDIGPSVQILDQVTKYRIRWSYIKPGVQI